MRTGIVFVGQVGVNQAGGAAAVEIAATLGGGGYRLAVGAALGNALRQCAGAVVGSRRRDRKRGMNHQRVLTGIVVGVLVKFDGPFAQRLVALGPLLLGAAQGEPQLGLGYVVQPGEFFAESARSLFLDALLQSAQALEIVDVEASLVDAGHQVA